MAGKIWVSLNGCDDTTRFEIEVNDAEREFLNRLCAAACAASEYGCMPTMACGSDAEPWDEDSCQRERPL